MTACILTYCVVPQGERRPLLAENGSINAQQDELESKPEKEEEVSCRNLTLKKAHLQLKRVFEFRVSFNHFYLSV